MKRNLYFVPWNKIAFLIQRCKVWACHTQSRLGKNSHSAGVRMHLCEPRQEPTRTGLPKLLAHTGVISQLAVAPGSHCQHSHSFQSFCSAVFGLFMASLCFYCRNGRESQRSDGELAGSIVWTMWDVIDCRLKNRLTSRWLQLWKHDAPRLGAGQRQPSIG